MHRFLLLLFAAFSSTSLFAQNKIEIPLQQAVRDNNFFRVRELLPQAEKQLPKDQFLFYKALTENKFDQSAASNGHIEMLLRGYASSLPDSLIITLLNTQAGNYLRLYQYGKAARTYQQLLTRFGARLSSSEQASYRNMLGLFEPLAAVPPQEMHLSQDTRIPAYPNKFNHLMVPVRSQDTTMDFIFDSGAGLSTISESSAKKMGYKILESKVGVGSGTSLNVQSRLAVAESLFVGDILFQNVVFLVMPDEKLSFPSVGLVIHGIIGFPVIHQMGEVHLQKDGPVLVRKTPVDKGLRNLFLDDQLPVVAVQEGTDTLLFNFDTGAKTTELSHKYYRTHQKEVERKGVKTTKHFGSAGGVVEADIYQLPEFGIQVGSQKVALNQVPVHTSEKTFTRKRDGNLGQDVMTQFDDMVLNFRYLYVDFVKSEANEDRNTTPAMDKKSKINHNPKTGLKLRILKSAEDAQGSLVKMEARYSPQSQ